MKTPTTIQPQTSSQTESKTPRKKTALRAWTAWFARRFFMAGITLWVVSLIVFVATTAIGDPVRAILGRDYNVSPERVATIREQLNLDAPWWERYFDWLSGLLTGDLGTSVASNLPVSELISEQVVNSLFLVVLVSAIMIPVALILALISARRAGKPDDTLLQATLLGMAGIPEFVTGILLVALFSTTVWNVLPAVTVLPIGWRPWHRPLSVILPVATLVISIVPYLARILRSTLVEALDSDYAELARLKGIPENRVLIRHVLPNTVVPMVQVSALQIGWLVGGVVLIEYLFNYPGIGALLVDSVRNSDFPMVQALTMIIATAYILVNLIADALSIILLPRARTGMVS